MAFLVIGAIKFAVNGVKDGIQAHKDFNDPSSVGRQSSSATSGDCRQRSRQPGPVYDIVTKLEHRRAAKSRVHGVVLEPIDVIRSEQSEETTGRPQTKCLALSQGEDYGPQDYHVKREVDIDAQPPSYDDAITPSNNRSASTSGFGSTSYAHQAPSRPSSIPTLDQRRHDRSLTREGSYSSDSTTGHSYTRRQSRDARRAEKALRKAHRRLDKAELRMDRVERRH